MEFIRIDVKNINTSPGQIRHSVFHRASSKDRNVCARVWCVGDKSLRQAEAEYYVVISHFDTCSEKLSPDNPTLLVRSSLVELEKILNDLGFRI